MLQIHHIGFELSAKLSVTRPITSWISTSVCTSESKIRSR